MCNIYSCNKHNFKRFNFIIIVSSFLLLNLHSSDGVTYSVTEGQTVHLTCNTTTDKEVVSPVDWLTGVRRDVYIYMWNGVLNDDFKPRFSVIGTTLVISNATINDSGSYWCVDDEGGGDQNRMLLNVSNEHFSKAESAAFHALPTQYVVTDSLYRSIQDFSTSTPGQATQRDTPHREITAFHSGVVFISLFVLIVATASVGVFLWRRHANHNNDTYDDKRNLLDKSAGRLVNTFSFDGTVRGYDFLLDALYVTREENPEIIAYNVGKDGKINNKPTTIPIPGLAQNADTGVVACTQNNCLYISDAKNRCIHRVDVIKKKSSSWKVEGDYGPLSVSVTQVPNVLVICRKPCKAHDEEFDTQSPTCECKPKLKEYSTEGALIREITLDSLVSLGQVLHAVELPVATDSGERRFCLAHAHPPLLSVIAVPKGNMDVIPRIVAEGYGPVTRLNQPRHLIVDKDGSLVVVDVGKRKFHQTGFDGTVPEILAPMQLVKLGPRLEFVGCVNSPDKEEPFHWNPLRACLDVKRRRLFVADGDGSNKLRLFSYPIDSMFPDGKYVDYQVV